MNSRLSKENTQSSQRRFPRKNFQPCRSSWEAFPELRVTPTAATAPPLRQKEENREQQHPASIGPCNINGICHPFSSRFPPFPESERVYLLEKLLKSLKREYEIAQNSKRSIHSVTKAIFMSVLLPVCVVLDDSHRNKQ